MIDNKICIVTGGGNGIGKAVAKNLSDNGATVIVNSVTPKGSVDGLTPAEETVQEIKDSGGNASVHIGDISSPRYIAQLIEDTVDKYDRIDGVVNFAGITRRAPLWEMTDDEWHDVISVNLRGHFNLLREISTHWKQRVEEDNGRLSTQRSFVGVSSRSSLGITNAASYSASKAGILGLIRSAALELSPLNIRVNALLPTASTRLSQEPESAVRHAPPPEKIGPIVTYLMSDSAEDITGITIRAVGDKIGIISNPTIIRQGYKDGGWTAEKIADRFRSEVASGIDLKKSERNW